MIFKITNVTCNICGHKIQKDLLPAHGPYEKGYPHRFFVCDHCWKQESILLPDKPIPRKYRVLHKQQIVNYTLDEVIKV